MQIHNRQVKQISRFLVLAVMLSLISPAFAFAQNTQPNASSTQKPAVQVKDPPVAQEKESSSAHARQKAYERQVRARHRADPPKGRTLMMVGVAGTSMAIGALAGGARGLAIGAIVGAWGAYMVHRFWRRIR